MKTHPALIVLITLLCIGNVTAVPVGTAFTYQGRLNDGPNPASGSYDLRCTLYDSSGGPTVVAGPLTNAATAVSNGLFTVTLDFGSVFNGDARWLELAVRTNGATAFNVLSPRQELTPAPYAIRSAQSSVASVANGVAPLAITSAALAPGAVTGPALANGTVVRSVNGQTDIVTIPTNFWSLGGNAGTTAGTHFLGTTDNQPLELKVNNQRGLRVEPGDGNPNVIGGHAQNAVVGSYGGVTIAGGGGSGYPNQASSFFATISGGYGNSVDYSASYSLIAGGAENLIRFGANRAAIGGGALNRVDTNANAAVIAGGLQNRIGQDAVAAVIGGGTNNWNASYGAVIAGGVSHAINSNSPYASIGGGLANTNDNAWYSTIAGGTQNQSRSNAPFAFIGGGFRNIVETNAWYGTIGGGFFNTVVGSLGMIPGGEQNVAASYAFAAGRRAQAGHPGAFVWADSTDAPFASTATNQFLIRASGNVGINTNNPQTALHVVGTVTADGFTGSGAGLTSLNASRLTMGQVPDSLLSASIQDGSKYDARFVNTAGDSLSGTLLLPANGFNVGSGQLIVTGGNVGIGNATPTNKLMVVNARCDGSSWINASDRNLKQDFAPVDPQVVLEKVAALPVQTWSYKAQPGQKHLGPVAQDFRAAFGLGADDTSIATVDESGVALAAIQGLNQKLERENALLKSELTELRKLVEALQPNLNGGAK